MNKKIKDSIIEEYKEKFSKKDFIPGESFIPVSGKVFDEKELVIMTEAVLEGWWTEGKYGKIFEQKMCEFMDGKYCAIVNSGSSANLLAITALMSFRISEEKRLQKGDEVITVAAGFPTTINPIIQNGLIPVFIDIELGTYNASIESIEKAITSKTKAIFLAHTLGNPYDIEAIMELAEKNNLWVIEDNCDALGSKVDGKYTGTFGHLSTFSFYPAHHITMAEGGAVMTDDPVLNKIIRSIRDWGRDCSCATGQNNLCGRRFSQQFADLPMGYDHKYVYSEVGYNLKATDIQAALGAEQMNKLPDFIQKRKDNFKYLFKKMQKFEDYFILPEWRDNADPSWFGFLLTIKDGVDIKRGELLQFLIKKKIDSRLLFGGNITKQPYFKNYNIEYRIEGTLKNTDIVMNNTFWIGVYPGLTEEMIDYIVGSFKEFLN